MKDKYVVFDLDDTLVYETEYLTSAYREIACRLDSSTPEKLLRKMLEWHLNRENVFELLIKRYPSVSMSHLLSWYRNHIPDIELIDGASELLLDLKTKNYGVGLITDGRSVTQRNKLRALGIENLFDQIVVSEEFGSSKPDTRNFQVFMKQHNMMQYYYIADNFQKDFISPNALGWTTIALKDVGKNIHKQDFEISEEFKPKYVIERLTDALAYIR